MASARQSGEFAFADSQGDAKSAEPSVSMRSEATGPLGGASILPMPDPEDLRMAPGRKIDLTEALQMAVQRNHDIAIQESNVVMYKAMWNAQFGSYDPYLELDFGRSAVNRESYSSQTGRTMFQNDKTDTVTLSAGKTWSTGTFLSFDLSATRGDYFETYDLPDESTTDAEFLGYWTNFGLNFEQDLLEGFGPRVGLSAIREAGAQLDQQTQLFGAKVLEVLSEVQQAYWELSYAAEELRIRRYSRALAQRQLAITRARVQSGQRSEVEMLQVEEQLAASEEAVLAAENDLWTREAALRQLLDLKQGDGKWLEPVPPPIPKLEERSEADILRVAMEKNPNILAMKDFVQGREYALIAPKNARLPDLKVTASLGRTGQAEDAGEAFKDLVTAEGLSWTAGISLQLPLPDRAARGQYQQAVASLHQAERQLAKEKASLAEKIHVAKRKLETTRGRLGFSSRRLELARQKLEAEEQRYQVGLSTLQDVLLFQEDLEEASLVEARARLDVLLTAAQLETLEGLFPEALALEEFLKGRR